MGEKTGITWAQSTFNPWWGCRKVPGSPACDHCYAEREAARFGWGELWKGQHRFFGPTHWDDPLRWNKRAAILGKPWRVFGDSMCDIGEVTGNPVEDTRLDEAREQLWDTVRQTPNLTWMFSTKRPENMPRLLPADWGNGYPNVWLGATVETYQVLRGRRLEHLLKLPAALHFVSCEPLLSPLVLSHYMGRTADLDYGHHLGWVIVGGESGPAARRTDPEWVSRLAQQCADFDVAFFFKQAGAVLAQEWGCKSKVGADPGEWPEELRIQQFPEVISD